MRHPESQSQQALIKWWAFAWRQYKLPCEELLFSIPNGGARSVITATIMKREGTRRGIPDLFLAVPRAQFHGLFIEMKAQEGRLSPEQKVIHPILSKQGYGLFVAHSTQEAINLIDAYLKL